MRAGFDEFLRRGCGYSACRIRRAGLFYGVFVSDSGSVRQPFDVENLRRSGRFDGNFYSLACIFASGCHRGFLPILSCVGGNYINFTYNFSRLKAFTLKIKNKYNLYIRLRALFLAFR